MSFDSAEAPNGKPWTSPVLSVGQRNMQLRLTTMAGASSSYAITFERSGEQEHFIKASKSRAQDWFGFSLSVAGDTFVTGAPFEDSGANGDQNNPIEDSGAAYVFVRSGQSWTEQAHLKANDAQASDAFGTNVAAEGDTIVVGAPRSSFFATQPALGSRSGVAYVFTRANGVWTQQKQISASNARYGDHFGMSCAIWGDTIFVGALYGGGMDGARGGAVYVYQRQGADWTERQIVTPSVPSSRFGTSIAIDGERMIVGAVGEDGNTGSAYVFERRDDRWVEEQRLRPDTVGTGSKFGWAVSLLGERAAIGAPHHPDNPALTPVAAGEAYVFERGSGGWQQTARIKAPVSDTADQFGTSVAWSKTALAIGANGEQSSATGTNGDQTNNDAPWAGAVYVFAKPNTSWESTVYLKANNTEGGATLGYVLAFANDELVSGAPFESSVGSGIDNTPTNNTASEKSGAVYVFR